MLSSHKRLAVLLLLGVATLASSKSIGSNVSFLPKLHEKDVSALTSSVDIASASYSPQEIRGGGLPATPTSQELKGTAIFLVLYHLFRVVFKKYGIAFPSQLGGCCILFTLMLLRYPDTASTDVKLLK